MSEAGASASQSPERQQPSPERRRREARLVRAAARIHRRWTRFIDALPDDDVERMHAVWYRELAGFRDFVRQAAGDQEDDSGPQAAAGQVVRPAEPSGEEERPPEGRAPQAGREGPAEGGEGREGGPEGGAAEGGAPGADREGWPPRRKRRRGEGEGQGGPLRRSARLAAKPRNLAG